MNDKRLELITAINIAGIWLLALGQFVDAWSTWIRGSRTMAMALLTSGSLAVVVSGSLLVTANKNRRHLKTRAAELAELESRYQEAAAGYKSAIARMQEATTNVQTATAKMKGELLS